jgi:hypothetical protein
VHEKSLRTLAAAQRFAPHGINQIAGISTGDSRRLAREG